jgi:putative acetyltransferase
MTGIEADDYHDICAEQSVWIATIDDMPIGFAQGIPGEIKYLFVDADHAGKGVGAELMERALHDARSDGVDTVKIIATLNAVPFYMKWGFQKIKQTVLPDRDDSLPPIDIVEMERAVFSR